jgi:hypothetical protein
LPTPGAIDSPEDLLADELIEPAAGVAAGIPETVDVDLELQLLGQPFPKRVEQGFHRFQVGRVQLLEISDHHLGIRGTGQLKPACEQRCLADLSSTPDSNYTVLPTNRSFQIPTDRALDITPG